MISKTSWYKFVMWILIWRSFLSDRKNKTIVISVHSGRVFCPATVTTVRTLLEGLGPAVRTLALGSGHIFIVWLGQQSATRMITWIVPRLLACSGFAQSDGELQCAASTLQSSWFSLPRGSWKISTFGFLFRRNFVSPVYRRPRLNKHCGFRGIFFRPGKQRHRTGRNTVANSIDSSPANSALHQVIQIDQHERSLIVINSNAFWNQGRKLRPGKLRLWRLNVSFGWPTDATYLLPFVLFFFYHRAQWSYVISFALSCKPYILTYMKDARMHADTAEQ